jgi:hypothetical protein
VVNYATVVLFASIITVTTLGCVAQQIDSAISKYQEAAPRVQLGDSKDRVRSLLDPTQSDLPDSGRKQPESFLREGVRVDIIYYRSRRQPDDLTTDDEFTPYVFEDDKLVGVGWTAIGGPKTQGQARPETNVDVHVEQPTTP